MPMFCVIIIVVRVLFSVGTADTVRVLSFTRAWWIFV